MIHDIEIQYRQLSDALFAAILREPHNFRKYAAKMTPAWFQASRFDRAAAVVFRLQKQYGKFSANGLLHECQKAGVRLNDDDVAQLMKETAGVDLDMAWSSFEPVYKLWVEHRAAQMIPGAISQGLTAEALRKKQDDFRRESGAYTISDELDFAAFDRWILDKLEGYEPDYPCKPHLFTMRAKLKYFQPGAIALIAGRPGMGKTQMALNLLEYFEDAGLHGVFNSLEMDYDALLQRRVGIRTGIDPNKDWSMLSPDERYRVAEASERIKGSKVRFVTEYGISAFISALYSIHYEKPIQYAIVDYLQLMVLEGNKQNRDLEIGEIMRQLMQTAKSLKICLIGLSQFSRAVEGRGENKRPKLADLRDSGSLEQAAHYVFAPYRPEYYEITEDEFGNSLIGKAEIITLKNRNGPTNNYTCNFDPVRGFYEDAPQQFTAQPQTVTFSRHEESIPF